MELISTKVSAPLGNPRDPPVSNKIPFDDPVPTCKEIDCNMPSLVYCEYCEVHCKKIHKLGHSTRKRRFSPKLEKLIEEYLEIQDEERDPNEYSTIKNLFKE